MNKILLICLILMLNACVVEPLHTHYGSYGYGVGVVSRPYYDSRHYSYPYYNRYNRYYPRPYHNRNHPRPYYHNPSRWGNWSGRYNRSHGGYRRH